MNQPVSISNRANSIKPSATLALTAKATELKKQGRDVIALNVGEPDFDTPEPIRSAGIRAIEEGMTRYTNVDGTAALKTAIVEKLKRENGLHYENNQILVSCGAKHSIFNCLMALINPGDEVIIPAPFWVSYPDMVMLTEGTPIIIDSTIEDHYKITPEKLAAAITDKTKMLMLNCPSNPTGQSYSKAELSALADVLLKHPDIYIISDDIYEHILWTQEPFANIVNACPALYDRTIVINGASKAYAMTGWRIGYAAADKTIIANMRKIQGQSTSNACSISQAAATEALKPQNFHYVEAMAAVFKERHDFLYKALKTIDGVKVIPSDGTFYLFPDISGLVKYMPNVNNDLEFAEQLMESTGVILTPGTPFGNPGCIRFSFAANMTVLEQAMERFVQFIAEK